ncbi:MAG TPA: hypothetical protein VFW03_28010 [Gemmatimonadaceae bacterium]|nr:hypothetical protein [Gemmatimonadaceae bacterium]
MARSFFARMGTIILTAVTLAACDRTPTGTSPNAALESLDVSFARGGNGGGKGSNTASDQPRMAISPTQLTIAVGQQAIVAVTYRDNRGNIIPVTNDKPTYYGCSVVLDTDPDCWSVVSIVPGGSNNRQATVTGRAPGTVQVYAADGLGTWVTALVTVQ